MNYQKQKLKNFLNGYFKVNCNTSEVNCNRVIVNYNTIKLNCKTVKFNFVKLLN